MKKSDNENATNINLDSHIMIIASWPMRYGDDIDLYVRDPRNEVIFFRNKNNAIMHLDRDDLGSTGDFGQNNVDGPANREIVTIRDKFPGTYVVNVHMFRKSYKDPVPVEVRIFKVKDGKLIIEKMVILSGSGQEKTVGRFKVENNGEIKKLNNLFIPIAFNIIGTPE